MAQLENRPYLVEAAPLQPYLCYCWMCLSQTRAGLLHKHRLGAGLESVVRLSRSGRLLGACILEQVSWVTLVCDQCCTPRSAANSFCRDSWPPKPAFHSHRCNQTWIKYIVLKIPDNSRKKNLKLPCAEQCTEWA